MAINLLYIFFAILGLSFLVFIHELGHYWMARRVGMKVETFSIGFGKPIYSWVRKGVKWQVGWLPFGGFVKIAGMDTEGKEDPYKNPEGFFGKKPWDRIKVLFMGPLVNILFAFLAFLMLWIIGGREKNFSEFTKKIGWVDPKSELYAAGVRPGDEISAYDGYPFQGEKDHLYAPMTSSTGEVNVKGIKINYQTGTKEPFDYTLKAYQHPRSFDRNITTLGVLNPASYVIYDKLPGGGANPLPEGSPMANSGIEYGDRILWVDGEIIFSNAQLSEVLNDGRVLLTIKRGNQVFFRRVPRVLAQEIRPDAEFREELIDWQHEADLNNVRFQDLYVLPYNLTHESVVENVLKFVDKENQEEAFTKHPFSQLEEPLQPGDRIIAAQGKPVNYSYQLLEAIQEKRVNIIVQRDRPSLAVISWNDADGSFGQNLDRDQLSKLASVIGTNKKISTLGSLHLLNPITPKTEGEFLKSPEAMALLAAENKEKRIAIEKIDDPQKRAHMLDLFTAQSKRLVLGLPSPHDRKVVYNPKPTDLFANVSKEIGRTLEALFTGTLSPKYMTGPVGIIQVVHSTSMVSIKEALFWLGAISLNLGLLNLLPIPVLDGGTILLSLYELATGKRIKPKVLEKVIFFFAVLLIAFFIFLTYNDILRVFSSFF